MKKLIMSATIVAIVASFTCTARSQETPKNAGPNVPHKVGLIDMARVFKEYKKFESLREDLKAEIKNSETESKSRQSELKRLQAQMKMLSTDSPDYVKLEALLIKTNAEYQAFSKKVQRQFLKKESQIYRTVYTETTDVVQKWAEYYMYTVVIRFNSAKLDTTDPQKLIQGLNRQIIYHRAEDDITDNIIEYLNRQYENTAKNSNTDTRRK